MGIPASEAVIRLGSEGGAQTAREINQTAGAMTELGAAAKGMTAEFSASPDVSGWADAGRQIAMTAEEASKFSGGMIGLSKTIEQTRLELGGFGLALDFAPGLSVVEGLVGAWTEREEALTRHLAQKNEELQSGIELLENANSTIGRLTASQQELLDVLRDENKLLRERRLAQSESNLETRKAEPPTRTWYDLLASLVPLLDSSKIATDLHGKATRAWALEVKRLTADLEAQKMGFADHEDMLRKMGRASAGAAAEINKLRDAHREAAEALELVDPGQRYEVELRNIKRRKDAELRSLEEVMQGVTGTTEGRVLIEEAAADRSALAWDREAQRIAAANKSAASQVENDWDGAAAAMGTHVEGFATALSGSIGSSTVDAAASFKNMADQMVAQLIRVAIQMAVMKFIPGATPVVSAAGMFQHGGMVPAPLGQPRMILAHGGERVVSPTGRGAPPGGEGGTTEVHNHFHTGVLTPDSQRTMIRQISRTQRGAGEKAFPR